MGKDIAASMDNEIAVTVMERGEAVRVLWVVLERAKVAGVDVKYGPAADQKRVIGEAVDAAKAEAKRLGLGDLPVRFWFKPTDEPSND